MGYKELAGEFLNYSYEFRGHHQQKEVNRAMHGELFVLLYILKTGKRVLPSDISREMNITTARIAAVLNSLDKKGLITREIDKNDRRKILVGLTPEGRDLADEYAQKRLESTMRILEMLGEHDARELVRILGKLVEVVNNSDEELW